MKQETKATTFKHGDVVYDLANIAGVVIPGDYEPELIRVAFGKDEKSNWRDLRPQYLSHFPTATTPIQEDDKHTPGKTVLKSNFEGFYFIESENGDEIASVIKHTPTRPSDKANAERIVECWNNYDQVKAEAKVRLSINEALQEEIEALKEANKELLEALNSLFASEDESSRLIAWNNAKKAIAKHSPKQ